VKQNESTSNGIRVSVKSEFSPQHSEPLQKRWFFIYKIRIENQSSVPVKLLNRSWIITDADGHVEKVRGAGVVGEQPLIAPGNTFEYSSGCPLGTPFGSMHGAYEMTDESGARFEVPIPPFALRLPESMN
jgi:ApaG protein